MKLTKDLLFELIREALEHDGLSCNEVHPEHTHNEWEDHKKEEEKKTKVMAKISIKPTTKLPGSQLEQLEQLVKEAMGIAEEDDYGVPADALDVAGQVAAQELMDNIYHKISRAMENWIYSNSRPIKDKDIPNILEQIKLDTEVLMLKLGRTMGEEPELDEPEDLYRSALEKRGSYEELDEGKPDTADTKTTKPKDAKASEQKADTRRKRRQAKQDLKET